MSGRYKKDNYYYYYIGECVCVCLCVYPSKHYTRRVCGPIGTKFGTHMQIHLEKVVGKINICPVWPRGHMGGFSGQKLKKMGEICQTAGQIGPKFGTHMRIHLRTNIG